MSKEIDAQGCQQDVLSIRMTNAQKGQGKEHQRMVKERQTTNSAKHAKKIAKPFRTCKGQEFIHLLSDKKHIEK